MDRQARKQYLHLRVWWRQTNVDRSKPLARPVCCRH